MNPTSDRSACRTMEPLLSAFVDRQLEESQATQVREHLAVCPACLGVLKTLESLGTQMASLKQGTPPVPAPATLLAGLRTLPTWVVALAVVRRWIITGGAVAVAVGVVWLSFRWAAPLPAILTSNQATQQTAQLSAGTTLIAKAGETVKLALEHAQGALTLHGPGALIVRQAEQGRFQHDPRLTVELPSGLLEIQMNPKSLHTVSVTTPQARIHLGGTWALVGADPVTTQLKVLEGSVALQSVASSKQVTLIAGQMAQVAAGWVKVGQIPMDEWLRYKGIASGASSAGESDQPASGSPRILSHEQR